MYATCLFCSGALGRNEAIEHFPVGRRLAFDAAKGRLWVVCKACARWNLTPLESRWEAIDEAERAYRDTKLRASTPNVGLAKLKDGTELVRIGSPMLPEFAAWRYGEVFKRRYRKLHMLSAASLVIPVGFATAQLFGITAAAGIGASTSTLITAYNLGNVFLRSRMRRRVRAMVTDDSGTRFPVAEIDAPKCQIIYDETSGRWDVQLEHRHFTPAGPLMRAIGRRHVQRFEGSTVRLRDDAARRAMATLLPIINSGGTNEKGVREAVAVASDEDVKGELLMQCKATKSQRLFREGRTSLQYLPPSARLAMEIVLHEADERRAMEGELAELEARWKEAEEIAAIADNMFLPLSVADRVEGMKREAGEGGD